MERREWSMVDAERGTGWQEAKAGQCNREQESFHGFPS